MTREEAIINLKLSQNRIGGIKKEEWNALQMAIEALQDRPKGDWIPCSERLPEDGVAVLTTTENKEVYIDQVITDPFKERYFQSNTAYDNFQVIAWMPLPEPFEGGDDGICECWAERKGGDTE